MVFVRVVEWVEILIRITKNLKLFKVSFVTLKSTLTMMRKESDSQWEENGLTGEMLSLSKVLAVAFDSRGSQKAHKQKTES